MTDFSISARDRLAAAIVQSDLQEGLNDDTFTHEEIKPSNKYNKNTRVVTTVSDQSVVRNRLAIYIDRDALTVPFTTLPVSITAICNNTDELRQALLTEYNVRLDADDVVYSEITGSTFTLQANPNSVGWTGSLELTFGETPMNFNILRTQNNHFPTAAGKYLRIR